MRERIEQNELLGEIESIEIGSAYAYRFSKYFIDIIARKIREERDGLRADLHIICKSPILKEPQSRVFPINLLSSRSRAEISNVLIRRHKDIPWIDILEHVGNDLYIRSRTMDSVESIYIFDEPPELEYLLDPLVPKGIPTLLYGEGGICKSMLAQFLSILAMSPQGVLDNYQIKRTSDMVNVLYLDWESEKQMIERRQWGMQVGNNIPPIRLNYVRCVRSFTDMIDIIEEQIIAKNIGFIIIDSLGAALAGNILEIGPVIDFINLKLRKLGVTSLFVSHVPKNGETPFGSAYIGYMSRKIWRLRKQQSMGSDTIKISLFNEKTSDGVMTHPIGFVIEFKSGKIRVTRRDGIVGEEFGEHLPLKERILIMLKDQPMTIKELSEELSGSLDTIRRSVQRLKKEGRVASISDNRWEVYRGRIETED